MKNRKKEILAKYVSPVLVILCVSCLFGGWLMAKNETTTQTLNVLADELLDVIGGGPVDMLNNELKEFGATLTGDMMLRHLRQGFAIVRDGAISPYEIAFKTKIISDFSTLYEHGMNFGFGDSIMTAIISLKMLGKGIRIFFIITVIYSIFSIIMTAKGGRFWNILLVIIYLVWWFAWYFVCAIINGFLSGTYYESVGMGCRLSFLSFAPIILSIAALIFAITGNKKEKKKEIEEIATQVLEESSDNEETAKADKGSDEPVAVDFSKYKISFDIDGMNETDSESPQTNLEYINETSLEGNFRICSYCGQINDNKSIVCCVCGKGL